MYIIIIYELWHWELQATSGGGGERKNTDTLSS